MNKIILTVSFLFFTGCIFTPPPSVLDEDNVSIDDNTYQSNLLRVAKSQLGVGYVYGGNSPESGFDCSGFVQYAYKEGAKKKLPRRSQDQAKVGTKVSKDELQSGDLLFFDTAKRGHINHVGIYIGEGKFIHATSGKKYCVTISNLNKGFYKRTFRFAKRVY